MQSTRACGVDQAHAEVCRQEGQSREDDGLISTSSRLPLCCFEMKLKLGDRPSALREVR